MVSDGFVRAGPAASVRKDGSEMRESWVKYVSGDLIDFEAKRRTDGESAEQSVAARKLFVPVRDAPSDSCVQN